MLKFCLGVAAAVSMGITSGLLTTPPQSVNQGGSVNRVEPVITTALPESLVLATSANTDAIRENIDRARAIVGLTVVGTGVAVIAYSATKGHTAFKLPFQSPDYLSRAERANPQLQRKLLRLLHDDQKAAERLVAQVKVNHPDRSANWWIEKVIYDLERDRGRY